MRIKSFFSIALGLLFALSGCSLFAPPLEKHVSKIKKNHLLGVAITKGKTKNYSYGQDAIKGLVEHPQLTKQGKPEIVNIPGKGTKFEINVDYSSVGNNLNSNSLEELIVAKSNGAISPLSETKSLPGYDKVKNYLHSALASESVDIDGIFNSQEIKSFMKSNSNQAFILAKLDINNNNSIVNKTLTANKTQKSVDRNITVKLESIPFPTPGSLSFRITGSVDMRYAGYDDNLLKMDEVEGTKYQVCCETKISPKLTNIDWKTITNPLGLAFYVKLGKTEPLFSITQEYDRNISDKDLVTGLNNSYTTVSEQIGQKFSEYLAEVKADAAGNK